MIQIIFLLVLFYRNIKMNLPEDLLSIFYEIRSLFFDPLSTVPTAPAQPARARQLRRARSRRARSRGLDGCA